MTLPTEFGFNDDRTSASSNSSFILESPVEGNDHLLDFVVTTVDQIDMAVYNSLESIGKRASALKMQPLKNFQEVTFVFFK